MKGYQLNNGIFIDFDDIKFKCPYCETEFVDEDDRYYDMIDFNKKFYTEVYCHKCKRYFGLAVSYMGDMKGFKLD